MFCCSFFCSAYSNLFSIMAKVQILNMVVLDNPCPFRNPFQFEVTFECIEDLPDGELCFVPHFIMQMYNKGKLM